MRGGATEGALKVLAEKIGVADARECQNRETAPGPAKGCQGVADTTPHGRQARDLEFDRGRKSMSVIVADGKGSNKNSLLVKSAPSASWIDAQGFAPDGSVTTLSPALREEIVATVAETSSSALRCLGFALKTGGLGKLAARRRRTTPGTRT